jgi:hypothetical protein
MNKEFKKLSKKIHQVNVDNGWWEDRIKIPKIMKESGLFTDSQLEYVENLMADQLTLLQISELVEAMEARRVRRVEPDMKTFQKDIQNGVDFKSAYKKSIKDTYWDEKGDTLIRLMDEIGFNDIDIIELIELKSIYNSTRGKKHGGKVS